MLALLGMSFGSIISALAAKELNAWKGERCSRLLAETGVGGQSGATLEIWRGLSCRNEGDRGQKEGTHDGWFQGTKGGKEGLKLLVERESGGQDWETTNRNATVFMRNAHES